MPARAIGDRLLVWGSDIDDATIEQGLRTARSPVVAGHVALMPDAHVGIGATIGSVIPTESAIIPSAVGVDIGCGMIAVRTDLGAADLLDDLTPLLRMIARAIPAGVGVGHARATAAADAWLAAHPPPGDLSTKQERAAREQLGTLGSGNHFFEVCLDEADRVWLVLHSGSRGVGNSLATAHIEGAKKGLGDALKTLEDPDLAHVAQGTPAFESYIADMVWAQAYAMENRAQMMDAAMRALTRFVGRGREVDRVNCHHNFAALEEHGGRQLWITRKGAIRAETGDRGIIPGSMGAPTFIVRGRGEATSYRSCAHGAGRRMSRRRARAEITLEQMRTAMAGRTWLADRARGLVDEAPSAYKDVRTVMADQSDLVEVQHELQQVVNYKGT